MEKIIMYSGTAHADLDEILEYMQGEPVCKDYDKALEYIEDMKFSFGWDLDNSHIYKRKAKMKAQQRYGEYIARYDRSKKSQWFACYNVDDCMLVINKIIHNKAVIRGI